MTKDKVLDLALEALGLYQAAGFGNSTDFNKQHEAFYKAQTAIIAIKQALAAPVQEPVAWPCVIAEADFEQNTIMLEMQCTDYKVGAGQHWLNTTPPAAQPAVPDAIIEAGESPEFRDGWNECRETMLQMLKARGNT